MGIEYKPADDDVIAIMDRVIERHGMFAPIATHDVRVEILMAWSDKGAAVKVHGAPALASIKVVSGEERARGGPDLRIKIDSFRFGQLSARSREAVIAHELYHVRFKHHGSDVERDIYGRPIVRLIPDDWCINGFRRVAEWYGEDSVERISYGRLGEILGQKSLPFDEEESEAAAADEKVDVDAELTAGVAEAEAARAAKLAADPDFIKGEAEGEAWHKARHAEDWRSMPLSDLRGYGLGAATITALWEAKVDALGPLFDLAEAGDLDTLELSDDQVDEVLAAKRSFLKGSLAAPWRGLGVASLAVPGPVSGLLYDAGVKTLGALADQLDEGGYSDLGLSRKWKTTVFEVERVRNALEAIRNPQDALPDPSVPAGKSWEDSKRDVEAATAQGVCPVCKGAPKTMCPACGKPGDPPAEPEKKPRRRRKPAGPAEARP